MENKEIEVRFLEVDKNSLVEKLIELGAKDEGEDLIDEIIFYDEGLKWLHDSKRIRIRTQKGKYMLSYKHHKEFTADGTEEIEFEVSDIKKAEVFLEKIGYPAYRHQQKKRHTLILNDVFFDFDTRPKIPTYLEIEGPSEERLKEAAKLIDLDWGKAIFEDPKTVLEKYYNIPIGTMRWFTFDRVE